MVNKGKGAGVSAANTPITWRVYIKNEDEKKLHWEDFFHLSNMYRITTEGQALCYAAFQSYFVT